jgi:hypothetical protein
VVLLEPGRLPRYSELFLALLHPTPFLRSPTGAALEQCTPGSTLFQADEGWRSPKWLAAAPCGLRSGQEVRRLVLGFAVHLPVPSFPSARGLLPRQPWSDRSPPEEGITTFPRLFDGTLARQG